MEAQDKLSVNIAGLKLPNPLILASGILGISPSSMHALAESGIGAVTTKSIGPFKRSGYCNPSVIGLGNGTFLNAVGLANPGINIFEKEIPIIKRNNAQIVIVSVFGDTPEDFGNIAYRAWQAGADAIELNVSCPHAEVSTIGADPDLTEIFVRAVRNKIDCPLFVKLSPNVTDITLTALSAEKAGADAVVAINTVRGLSIDINTFRPILSHGIGGLSGKSIKPIGLKDVFLLYNKLKIPIIGCGGISTWEDVVEYFLAGSSAVQIGSCLYNGYNVVKEINNGLFRFLEEKSIGNISQITGKAHQFQTEVKSN